MQRIASLVAGSVLLALPGSAQQKLDSSRLFPITTPVRHAGTVNVTTGQWTNQGQATKVTGARIFDNSCTWAGGAFYSGFDWCEENYDEGRIPSPSDPNAPNGAESANEIRFVEVSYCTFMGPLAGVGGYDMDLAFWDKLNGDCLNGNVPTPPPVSSTATAYIPLAGLGLPGSTSFGFQACWLITLNFTNSGFFLAGDGDGTFDGTDIDDKFIWMQRQNTTFGANQIAGSPDGFFVAGDPAVGDFGACTYDIPCGTDPLFGNSCGTGLGAFDGNWINIDGIAAGITGQPPVAGCVNSTSYYGPTGCYWFQGYPTNPFASFWLRIEGENRSGPEIVFCAQSKPTSVAGCAPALTTTGLSLADSWSVSNIPRHASQPAGPAVGIFIYTNGVGIGQSAFNVVTPIGTLCLSGFKRSSPACAPAILANAQPGVCNAGPSQTQVNCNGGALGIQVGHDVNVQYWGRDPLPGNTGNALFSSGIYYTVQ